MKWTLSAYVSRLFLGQLAVVGFGFVALLQVFDLLKNARDVMERHGESVANLAYYAALRLPGTVSFLLPLCVLVAALMTLTRLAQHNEIVALKAAGLSIYRFLLCLAPAVIAVAVAQWLLSDQLAPAAHRTLRQWDAEGSAASDKAGNEGREIWVRRGGAVVRIAEVLGDGHILAGVTVFPRDGKGNLTERLVAGKARRMEGGWFLFDVERTVWPLAESPRQSHLNRVAWAIDLIPSDLVNLSIHPNGLTLHALLGVAESSGLGKHPEYFYRAWVQKRIATPVSALIMVLLAASMAQTMVRGHGGAASFMAGVGLGFLYLIADGVVFTLGEAGSLPPFLAAWAPLVVFGCIAGAALIAREGV